MRKSRSPVNEESCHGVSVKLSRPPYARSTSLEALGLDGTCLSNNRQRPCSSELAVAAAGSGHLYEQLGLDE